MSDQNTIGLVALKNLLGAYAPMVLEGVYIQRLPREGKGDRKKYRVLKELPTKEQFEKLQKLKYTARLDDVISGACGEISTLAEEIRGWYDNLPSGLQSGDKGSMLDECANQLENVSEPDIPDFARSMAVVAIPMLDVNSRADRRDDAVHQLQQAVQALQDAKDADQFALYHDDANKTVHIFVEKPEDEENAPAAEQKDELQTLIDELDNIISEVEGAEFPGMY